MSTDVEPRELTDLEKAFTGVQKAVAEYLDVTLHDQRSATFVRRAILRASLNLLEQEINKQA